MADSKRDTPEEPTMNNFDPAQHLPEGAIITGMVCAMEYLDPETGEPRVGTFIAEGTAFVTANALAHIAGKVVDRMGDDVE